jgi:hypothetical protein
MSLTDILHDQTGGRPFVLVAMAYEHRRTGAPLRQEVFTLVRDVVEREFNVACLRADRFDLQVEVA